MIMAVKEKFRVKITNRFMALENLDDIYDDVDISMTWEGIIGNMKTTATRSYVTLT
jgi:hypothetical protein